jgi:protein-tyrosine-phosphatase
MAEVIFKRMLAEEGLNDWKVGSAGVWAQPDISATPTAVAAMNERGLNLSAHLSKPVTDDLINGYDLVLVMERRQQEALTDLYPQHADRIYLLGEMAGLSKDVDDPVGEPLERYLETAKDIHYYLMEALPAMQEKIAQSKA